MTSTFDRLHAMLAADYVASAQAIAMDTRLADLGVDSLAAAELLFDIEDQFKLTVPQSPVPLVTVGDVVAYIDALSAAQHPPQVRAT